jgi:hypothetical protein
MPPVIQKHLPLTTTLIEFEPEVLDPPPTLTTDQEFQLDGANQASSAELREDRLSANSVDGDDTSSLSSPPDSDLDSDLDNNQSSKIAKPPGEPGRPGRGGYNLEDRLAWGNELFDKVTVRRMSII